MADRRPLGNYQLILLCFLLVAYWGILLRNITMVVVSAMAWQEPWRASPASHTSMVCSGCLFCCF
jgi:hypothetical protein